MKILLAICTLLLIAPFAGQAEEVSENTKRAAKAFLLSMDFPNVKLKEGDKAETLLQRALRVRQGFKDSGCFKDDKEPDAIIENAHQDMKQAFLEQVLEPYFSKEYFEDELDITAKAFETNLMHKLASAKTPEKVSEIVKTFTPDEGVLYSRIIQSGISFKWRRSSTNLLPYIDYANDKLNAIWHDSATRHLAAKFADKKNGGEALEKCVQEKIIDAKEEPKTKEEAPKKN